MYALKNKCFITIYWALIAVPFNSCLLGIYLRMHDLAMKVGRWTNQVYTKFCIHTCSYLEFHMAFWLWWELNCLPHSDIELFRNKNKITNGAKIQYNFYFLHCIRKYGIIFVLNLIVNDSLCNTCFKVHTICFINLSSSYLEIHILAFWLWWD